MPLNAIVLWKPVTCDCTLHMAYDDTLPSPTCVEVTEVDAKTIHQLRVDNGTPNTNVRPQPSATSCPAHKGLAFANKVSAVREESNRNNTAINEILSIKTINPHKITFSFDTNRNLTINTVSQLTTAQVLNVQNWANSTYKDKKVTVK